MKIGVIPDTHFPAVHPGALDFILDTFSAWEIDKVVHIGDVSDLHGPSFHEKNPQMPGPLDEFLQAADMVQQWDEALHDAGWVSSKNKLLVCEGNHDDRPRRVADSCGLTDRFLHAHEEVWNTPDWEWALEHTVDGVLYTHGHKGCGGGKDPARLTLEKGCDMSIVLGHYHTRGGVSLLAGRQTRRWGMNVGCLVDRTHPALAYASRGTQKPLMSCGVVIDGHPYYEIMPCGAGEKYHRSKFKKKGRA